MIVALLALGLEEINALLVALLPLFYTTQSAKINVLTVPFCLLAFALV